MRSSCILALVVFAVVVVAAAVGADTGSDDFDGQCSNTSAVALERAQQSSFQRDSE